MKVYVVVAFWLTASDCTSGDSNGTVLGVLMSKPSDKTMQEMLVKWVKDEDLELEDAFGDPHYGVEYQESELIG